MLINTYFRAVQVPDGILTSEGASFFITENKVLMMKEDPRPTFTTPLFIAEDGTPFLNEDPRHQSLLVAQ